MLARAVNVRFQPHKVKKGIQILEEEIVPVLRDRNR